MKTKITPLTLSCHLHFNHILIDLKFDNLNFNTSLIYITLKKVFKYFRENYSLVTLTTNKGGNQTKFLLNNK